MPSTRAVVGVVGASARAAVHSLARAGFDSWAIDLFNDRDLVRVAECRKCPIEGYPAALADLAEEFPPSPLLYTGGLENYPAVVARLASRHSLHGNPPSVLEAVRDPYRLFPALVRAGLYVPDLVVEGWPCPADRVWLRKPLHSSAGNGIRFARSGEPASPSHLFQEFVEGIPGSAVFIDDILAGVTEQLTGERTLHAKPFGYCGNIGGVDVPAILAGQLRILGRELREKFGVQGVWGADFILNDGQAYCLEVNPRYPASVEVVEHATRVALLAKDCVPQSVGHPRQNQFPSSRGQSVIAKAIYYSPHDLVFPQDGPWEADLAGDFDPWKIPTFADIPESGSRIAAHQPVLTILVSGSSTRECRERLQSQAQQLDNLFSRTQS